MADTYKIKLTTAQRDMFDLGFSGRVPEPSRFYGIGIIRDEDWLAITVRGLQP
jgi:hypothetical protein